MKTINEKRSERGRERVIKILRNAEIVFNVVTVFNQKEHGKFCA